MADGLRNGTATNEVVRQITDTLKDQEKHRVTRLVRTTMSKSYNNARWRGFQTVADRVEKYRYISVLDDRTTEICRRLDSDANGLYSKDEAEAVRPPNHFQCRSVISPVFKDEGRPAGVAETDGGNPLTGDFEQVGDFWKPIKK
jgi:SPP1 gp7 family putative phage head morphogenesis protein